MLIFCVLIGFVLSDLNNSNISTGDISVRDDDDDRKCTLDESVEVLDDLILAFRCNSYISPLDVDDKVKTILEIVDDPLIHDPLFGETVAFYTGLMEGKCHKFSWTNFDDEITKYLKCYGEIDIIEVKRKVYNMLPDRRRKRRRRKR